MAAPFDCTRLTATPVAVSRLLRLSRFPGTEPWWGRTGRYRFDDPDGGFGVTYCADTLDAAFCES